jgi:hypothetical protein
MTVSPLVTDSASNKRDAIMQWQAIEAKMMRNALQALRYDAIRTTSQNKFLNLWQSAQILDFVPIAPHNRPAEF